MSAPSDISSVWEELARAGGRIVYLVLDGAGGLRDGANGKTALEMARTPISTGFAARDSLLIQFKPGLLGTVGLPRCCMNPLDLPEQFSITPGSITFRTLTPRVVAATGHLHHLVHARYVELVFVPPDKRCRTRSGLTFTLSLPI
jgi:hypothetical protein